MKRLFLTSLAVILAAVGFAQTKLGIVNRQQFGGFWRYDFNYETVDTDGKTPIVLSAAIFMTNAVHDKEAEAKGCALLNHYTITTNDERPTNVTGGFTLEGVVVSSSYFIIESDGIGFGLTSDRKQSYLEGRTAARNDIDALLYAKTLLEAEGFVVPKTTANLGYSQGGHSGMWVNRLVAEGYRSAELPKINISILGGGPYDIYSHYRYLVDTGVSQYPVAIPLIANGVIASGDCGVTYSDLFASDFIAHIPTWFDTKQYTTTAINDSIFRVFGNGQAGSVEISKMMSASFLNPESDVMKRVGEKMKENSLVYESWQPSKTDTLVFVHSKKDEVVPYLNMENMATFLQEQGYSTFSIDSSYEQKHTNTGSYYALLAMVTLQSYEPKTEVSTGVEAVEMATPSGRASGNVYSIDGRLVRKGVSGFPCDLPKGIYIMDGHKIFVK